MCLHPTQDAGCEVHAVGSLPFDCDAALNNFFRAPRRKRVQSGRQHMEATAGFSLRPGHQKRSTGAAPSRARAARATTPLPWMPATAWFGSTSRQPCRFQAGAAMLWTIWHLTMPVASARHVVAGERLLDLGRRARPRPLQLALRLPCGTGQLAYGLVRGEKGWVLFCIPLDCVPLDSELSGVVLCSSTCRMCCWCYRRRRRRLHHHPWPRTQPSERRLSC